MYAFKKIQFQFQFLGKFRFQLIEVFIRSYINRSILQINETIPVPKGFQINLIQ